MVESVRKRLLLVDDDPIQLEFYQAVLESDYEVITACSYSDAIRILTDDLAVDGFACDLRLNDGHRGTELLAWVRQYRPGLMDYSMIMSGELSVESGTYGVRRLHKPVQPAELLRAMQHLLG